MDKGINGILYIEETAQKAVSSICNVEICRMLYTKKPIGITYLRNHNFVQK